MSIDKFLDRQFNEDSYNCLHFACEAWLDLTGQDIRQRLDDLLAVPAAQRRIGRAYTADFKRLDRPHSPCLVLMQRPRSTPHIGVYVRGRVLHIREEGVEFQPLNVATLGFKRVRFYQ